jgi:hypothetical protein
MAEAGTLRFLLAPADALAADPLSSEDLAIVQGQGVTSAFALRIVVSHDLGGRFQRVCDAITPRFEPERLWLGVYQASPANPSHWQRLDSFSLSEARNESCWFYPTHDGHYLSWQRQLQVRLAPGQVAEPAPESPAATSASSGTYSRDAVALLWSLLADDTGLTCVGLTYAGRRIDWPLSHSQWAPSASWCTFSVESCRAQPLIVHSRRKVCASPSTQEPG